MVKVKRLAAAAESRIGASAQAVLQLSSEPGQLAERFPIHVVCDWIDGTMTIAAESRHWARRKALQGIVGGCMAVGGRAYVYCLYPNDTMAAGRGVRDAGHI